MAADTWGGRVPYAEVSPLRLEPRPPVAPPFLASAAQKAAHAQTLTGARIAAGADGFCACITSTGDSSGTFTRLMPSCRHRASPTCNQSTIASVANKAHFRSATGAKPRRSPAKGRAGRGEGEGGRALTPSSPASTRRRAGSAFVVGDEVRPQARACAAISVSQPIWLTPPCQRRRHGAEPVRRRLVERRNGHRLGERVDETVQRARGLRIRAEPQLGKRDRAHTQLRRTVRQQALGNAALTAQGPADGVRVEHELRHHASGFRRSRTRRCAGRGISSCHAPRQAERRRAIHPRVRG